MEEYRVIITRKAINDIMGISSYISEELFDVVAAARLVEKLKIAIESLSYMPKRNALLKDEELAFNGMRRILVDNYIIFYICSDKELLVSIIRVLYHKRDWNNLV